ncbi:ribonuclease HI family protein [Candidatus Gottesmanbacteria bacterium]|nr:ribonuclease HI family protein [Candidatus Gottesmanbacteria bacterium]
MGKLFIYTDGGARGNPGPAAIGVVIKDEQEKILTSFGKRIGETTNNVAEYMAVIEALRWIKENCSIASLPHCSIVFSLDSRLVVNQLNGLFKIKDARIRDLIVKIRELETEVGGNVSYCLIPREKNFLADNLVKKVLEYCAHVY